MKRILLLLPCLVLLVVSGCQSKKEPAPTTPAANGAPSGAPAAGTGSTGSGDQDGKALKADPNMAGKGDGDDK